MRTKYIPLIIMLIAALAACIVTYINQYSVTESLIIVLIVFITFYIIGIIIKKIAEKFLVVESVKDIESILDMEHADLNSTTLNEETATEANK